VTERLLGQGSKPVFMAKFAPAENRPPSRFRNLPPKTP